jgi:hypothetical protein
MELLHSSVVLALLWVAAGLVMVWILGPAIGFLVARGPLRTDVSENADDATPGGDDRAFADKARALMARGFVPLGRTVESMRFFTPLHWNWRSDGSRWLGSADGTTFVSFHRVAGADPLRMSAMTIFEGGGLVQTASPGVGLEIDYGPGGRRTEIGEAEPTTLLETHAQQVASMVRTQAKVVRRASLRDVAAEDEAFSKRAMSKAKTARGYAPVAFFLMLLFSVLPSASKARVPGAVPALGILMFAMMFAGMRWMILPSRVPKLVRTLVGIGVMILPTFAFMKYAENRAAARRAAAHPPAGQIAPPADVGQVSPAR